LNPPSSGAAVASPGSATTDATWKKVWAEEGLLISASSGPSFKDRHCTQVTSTLHLPAWVLASPKLPTRSKGACNWPLIKSFCAKPGEV
jgi:hypothetical protein